MTTGSDQGRRPLPEGSLIVLDPGVTHNVSAPETSQMLLAVGRVAAREAAGP